MGNKSGEFAGVPGPRMSVHMIVTRRVLELTQARRVKTRVTVSKVQTSHKFPVHHHLIVRRTFVSMSTPSGNRLVYLEDLEQPSSQATATSTNEEKPSAVAASSDHGEDAKTKVVTPSTASNTSNGKRQRTLVDMFGSTTSSQGSKTPSKRPKVAAAAASSSRDKPSAASATGAQLPAGGSSSDQQALNSIPFSLSEYTTSLTEDQKRLLNLECETMGKSW